LTAEQKSAKSGEGNGVVCMAENIYCIVKSGKEDGEIIIA